MSGELSAVLQKEYTSQIFSELIQKGVDQYYLNNVVSIFFENRKMNEVLVCAFLMAILEILKTDKLENRAEILFELTKSVQKIEQNWSLELNFHS